MLSILLSLIFLPLAIIHFSWAFGGTLGFAEAIPTNEEGKRVMSPGKLDSAIVGIGLAIFGLFYTYRSGLVNLELPGWIITSVGWIIPAIFLLRAIGDFKYVGFFKKVRNTPFGKRDTRFFAPLCLLISVMGIIVQLNG